MKFAQALTYYRERAGLNKLELAQKIDVESPYIIGIEKGRVRPPTIERVEQIASALKLEDVERLKLIELAYEERQKPSDLAFQEALKDQKGIKTLITYGLTAHKSPKLSEQPIILSFDTLYKKNTITSFINSGTKRGECMIRSVLEDSDNAPDFIPGDEIEILLDYKIEDDKFYIIRDGKNKKVILRKIKQYGDSLVLRTTNMKIDEPFDSKRFEIIGKVTKHTRNL